MLKIHIVSNLFTYFNSIYCLNVPSSCAIIRITQIDFLSKEGKFFFTISHMKREQKSLFNFVSLDFQDFHQPRCIGYQKIVQFDLQSNIYFFVVLKL